MNKYLIQPAASTRLEEIYRYTLESFGPDQADRYLDGVFSLFQEIADRRIAWKRIPSEFGVDGYYAPYQSHLVFWKSRSDGQMAIVAVLHRRMDLARRLQEDFREP